MASINFASIFRNEKIKDNIVDVLACLTLAHLSFIPIWELVIGGTPRLFLLDDSIGNSVFIPLLVLTLMLTLVATVVLHICKIGMLRSGGTAWVILVLFAAFSLCRIFIFSTFVRKMPLIAGSAKIKMSIMIVWILLLLGTLAWSGLNRWVLASRRVILAVSPLLLLIWVQVASNASSYGSDLEIHGKVIPDSHKTIWVLIFDEFDANTALDNPIGKAEMPELALWKTFSINCNSAYPPTGSTLYSIPALIHGKQFGKATSDTDYEFTQRTAEDEGKKSNWNWSDSLFSDIKRQGGNTAIVGWCFPYAPFYKNSVDTVRWVSPKAGFSGFITDTGFISLLRTILTEACFGPVAYSLMSDETRSQAHVGEVNKINQYLDEVLDIPLPDLVWVHYPVPHSPAVTGALGTYLDNLKVVDKELGRFRNGLIKLGRFNEATIIVLGDHWFRKTPEGSPFARGLERRWDIKDHRTPFLVKLPNQINGTVHGGAFNTIILRGFVNALHKGEIKTPEETTAWLDSHTLYGESPTTMVSP